jgi:zinc and cadmium transporter
MVIMSTWWQVIIFSLLGGLVSLAGGIVIMSYKPLAKKIALYATPFAAGALLGAVFFDLLPEGIETDDAGMVLTATLVGLVAFFFIHRALHWFHHHDSHDHAITNPKTGLIILGDTLHNALDGVAIAAAFLLDPATGVVTTLAVAAHEIPQEIGDMGLLMARGMKRRRVIWVNIFSSLATTVAAIVVYALGSDDQLPIGILLGVSAGFLLYIAASDIIPELNKHIDSRRFGVDWQGLLLLAGIVIVALAVNISHGYVEHDHEHDEEAEHTHEEASDHPPVE